MTKDVDIPAFLPKGIRYISFTEADYRKLIRRQIVSNRLAFINGVVLGLVITTIIFSIAICIADGLVKEDASAQPSLERSIIK